MQKRLIRRIVGIVLALSLALPAFPAFAEPYISINNTGGNSLSISVSGGYGQVDLVYTLPGSSLPTVISNIGNAYGGSFSGALNLNEYGIVSGSQVYVRVGCQQSNTITVGYGAWHGGGL